MKLINNFILDKEVARKMCKKNKDFNRWYNKNIEKIEYYRSLIARREKLMNTIK